MRKSFALLFIFFCVHLSAQNYSPFVFSQTSVYQRGIIYNFNSTPTYYHMFRADTMYTQGTDTIYRNYRTFDYTNMYCASTHDTNVVADKVVLRNNGDLLFFNAGNDTILVKRNASVGDAWHLFNFPNGDYLEATLSSISFQNVVTAMDSVKIISLQAKNSSGNNINNIFNGNEIWLSKDHGLAKFYTTLDFPNDVTEFTLAGMNAAGTPALTHDFIYNFNVGDDFQWTGGWNQMMSGSFNDYKEWKVISKYISANSDTTIYKFDEMHLEKFYQYTPNYDSTITFIHDTVTQYVIVSLKDYIDSLTYSPLFTPFSGAGYALQYIDTTYHSRLKKRVDPYYFGNSTDTCVYYPVGLCVSEESTYAAGLGLIKITNDDPTWCYHEDMNWFQKNPEQWGTPFDWSVLLGTNEISIHKNNIHVYPVPATGVINISFDGSTTNSIYELENVFGERVATGIVPGNNFPLDISTLANGTYFITIINSQGKTTLRFVK
ncbi:MAG: T9SS type A sorting domain-containing protein [Bacteroidetes bacterium]|nr:T9SS type A sorting domain-containing protein [Bacteroidota bacterium]